MKIYLVDCESYSVEELLNSKYLSPVEKCSFEKYKNIEVKKEKIISRILKNKYIGEYHLSDTGKPVSNSIYFNISHSHQTVVLVMDSVPIGIDIEKIRPVNKDLVDFISSEYEKEYIKDDESFYKIWTNKEALAKAYGSGINEKPNHIPGLPINNKKIYNNDVYYNKTIKYEDFIITVSRNKDEDYSLEIIVEKIYE